MRMSSIVCTLFENHYHYGVAGLVNSLYQNGFRGEIYAGYRGSLPDWALVNQQGTSGALGGISTLYKDGITIHFVPLTTDVHLTNYKPDFMLEVLRMSKKEIAGIFYFDPDIVIKCRWSFFEGWIQHGIGLVHEITANDMPDNHPIRMAWLDVVAKIGKTQMRQINSYINGGFVGIARGNEGFLHTWKKIQDVAASHFDFNPKEFMPSDRTHLFFASDQDALNIAAMCCDEYISEMGPDAMDFVHGGWVMSHAVGRPKPWKKQFFIEALKGNPPSMADKEYWECASNRHLVLYSKVKLRCTKIELKVASFLGRFYRKY